jgi:hypothetical protein
LSHSRAETRRLFASQRKQSQGKPTPKSRPKGEAYQQRPPGREVSDEGSQMQPIVRDATRRAQSKIQNAMSRQRIFWDDYQSDRHHWNN